MMMLMFTAADSEIPRRHRFPVAVGPVPSRLLSSVSRPLPRVRILKLVPLTEVRTTLVPLPWNPIRFVPVPPIVAMMLGAIELLPGPGTRLCGLRSRLSPLMMCTVLGAVTMCLQDRLFVRTPLVRLLTLIVLVLVVPVVLVPLFVG